MKEEMDLITTYLGEDSVEGIFTAIYLAWEKGTSCTAVEVQGGGTMSLFATYIEVATDLVIAEKVANSIRRKLSQELYEEVYRAALCAADGKAQTIYRFLVKAFRVGTSILQRFADEDVMRMFEMTRTIGNESHRYLEFVRFEELNNGVLISKIQPEANVIPLIADHFADRLHCENWIILDTNRHYSVVHRAGEGYIFTYDITEESLNAFAPVSDKEVQFQQLWKRFFDTIAIEERKNRRTQMNFLPLKFRNRMTEFQ